MTEIYKTRRLKIVSAIFIAIIMIGFITLRTPDYNYTLTIDQTIKGLSLPENAINPSEVIKLMESNNKKYLFLDVRNPHEFLTNQIENSINIPASEILKEENFNYFRKMDQENITIIIYGNDALQANGTRMLLNQLGINNVKILTVGFNTLSQLSKKNLPELHQIEDQIFSDSTINSMVNSSLQVDQATSLNKQKITPVKREKKPTTAGGC
jgi:rhodanese-related sulfurtransferase